MRAVLETLQRRAKVLEKPLPTKPIEEAIAEAVSVFNTHLADSPRPLEMTNPFGTWKTVSHETARDGIGSWLENIDETSNLLDACRAVEGLQVVVFKGHSESSGRNMNLTATEYTRLGDGTASFAWGEWSMTQKKGEERNKTHLKIRQKKQPPCIF